MEQISTQTKRVFVGCSIDADWPQQFPPGKILTVDNRHQTIAFLGNVDPDQLTVISNAPKPTFAESPAGQFDKLLPLPKRRPRAITYHAHFTIEHQALFDYQQLLIKWFANHKLIVDDRPFLPHVTIARPPFKASQWRHHFCPFSFYITGVHLYESLGHRQYQIILTYYKDGA